MMKRGSTPLSKERYSKQPPHQGRALKDIKNTTSTRQSLSRQPSTSKLTQCPPSRLHNPESPLQLQLSRERWVSEEMRQMLVEWLIEMAHSSKAISRETTFLAVRLLDICLGRMSHLTTQNLQLVATTCIFMAAKYEEVYPQHLKDFLRYTADAYSKQQLLQMEAQIFSLINFKMTLPTRCTELSRLMEYRPIEGQKCKAFAKFLLEVSLLREWPDYQEYEVAEAAVFLACKVMRQPRNASDSTMELAYKLMGVWRQQERGVVAYLHDNEKCCYVGGLRLIY